MFTDEPPTGASLRDRGSKRALATILG